MKKSNNKLNIIKLTVALLLLVCFATTAFADVYYPDDKYLPIDPTRRTSLTMQFEHNGFGVDGIRYSLYLIATLDHNFQFQLTEQFAKYPVTLQGLDTNGWRALSTTLAAYAARDHLEPVARNVTDPRGLIKFMNLQPGLYLVVGERHMEGDILYIPEPFVVTLPYLNEETDEWDYDLVSEPKYVRLTGAPAFIDVKVSKKWNDDDSEDRPNSVIAQLICDGEIYDEVELNADNNWTYTWEELESDHTWLITEKDVPEKYYVLVEENEFEFTITNSSEDVINNVTPTPTEPVTDQPTNGPQDTVNPTEPPVKIPQTGQLWWPVPLMFLIGIAIFAIGFLRWKKSKKV